MRLVFKLVLLLSVFSLLFPKFKSAVNTFKDDRLVYLVAGLDDAAENTDALMLINYSPKEKLIAVIQIPRDTYAGFGKGQNKINQLYSSYKASGNTAERSMELMAEFIEDNMGIALDGYAAVTTAVLVKFVDALGGVSIEMPSALTVEHQGKRYTLDKGQNLLDGEAAEAFVRYRKGYATADIGRIDAQKIFISGLYCTLCERVGGGELIRAYSVVRKELITDFGITDLLVASIKYPSKLQDMEIRYITMAGEAIEGKRRIWYYVLNKNAAEALFNRFSILQKPFDEMELFTNHSEQGFDEIYYNGEISYKEYTDKDLTGIKIP